jgi:hypoxanthine phosphoribosyltransferase
MELYMKQTNSNSINIDKIHLSQNDFNILLEKLFILLETTAPIKTFNQVVGIENGGLNISIPISKRFHIPHSSIKISCYSSSCVPSNTTVIKINEMFAKNKFYLIVDDIIDTGLTIKHFSEKTGLFHKKDFLIASIYWCSKSPIVPDFFVKTKEKSQWIVYPWENN